LEALTGWWDDYFWASVVVLKIFIASLGFMVFFIQRSFGSIESVLSRHCAKKLGRKE